jgi:hypothetical protein
VTLGFYAAKTNYLPNLLLLLNDRFFLLNASYISTPVNEYNISVLLSLVSLLTVKNILPTWG